MPRKIAKPFHDFHEQKYAPLVWLLVHIGVKHKDVTMNAKWNYQVSIEYKIKSYLLALAIWIAFNLVAGFITGDADFPDNYFVLIICLLVAAFKCSYSVAFKNGQMNERQLGMITSNIDLYKVTDVKEVNGSIKLYGDNDSQFSIEYDRLPKDAHEEILNSIKPLYGKEPEIINETTMKTVSKKVIENYTHSIFGGVVLSVLSVVGYFTGTIYLPSRHGYIVRADGEDYFTFFLILIAVLGVASVVYGVIGKLGRKNA